MIKTIDFHINQLDTMKKYPSELYYIGNIQLLHKMSVSFVGSRKPNQYAKQITHTLASELSKRNICIISGGALGIDTIAHKAAGSHNTIMVSGTGLDIRYPAINKEMISHIEEKGLVLSQFAPHTKSRPYNFPLRNEIIVALSDILIVPYADLNSGTMHSINYALKMNKKIYVLPHQIGNSEGTNELLSKNKATAIYNIDDFLSLFKSIEKQESDPFMEYCKTNPNYNDAIITYKDKIFEAELFGDIEIKNGKIFIPN